MIMKSLDFMPCNETLHLPLKVWGLFALHKESLGSAGTSGCGAGTWKLCGTEGSHVYKQPIAGPERDPLTFLNSCG